MTIICVCQSSVPYILAYYLVLLLVVFHVDILSILTTFGCPELGFIMVLACIV
jgi:hypothetical protein